jgi:hypothetical protein
LPSEEEQSANDIQMEDQNASTDGTNLNEMSIISNGSSNNELLIESQFRVLSSNDVL